MWVNCPFNLILVSKQTIEVVSCGTHQGCGFVPEQNQDMISFRSSSSAISSDSYDRAAVAAYYKQRPVPKVQSGFSCWSLCAQSEDVGGTTELTPIVEQQDTTMGFLEKTNTYSVGMAAQLGDEAFADETPNVSLSEFLSRPAKILTFTWNESDAIGTTHQLSPWQQFFSQTAILNKLTNYAWLKCDLKIKIMVNASPFYYGAMIASYFPMLNFRAETIIQDAGTRWLIPTSQRPHAWIYPQNNEGAEMTLPFFWKANWLSTLVQQDFYDMGILNFINYTLLSSANGISGTGVTVTVYAWAENVVVSGPTAGLIMQAKDEYGTGPVSSVASAVATMAQALSAIPVIGKYATATQVGASAIAKVSSSLGFSNPPVIADTMPLQPTPFPVLASTEQSHPIQKLTIDPKNELSVDPGVAGLKPVDELSISHLVQRESYLTTVTWATSAAADTILFQTAVTPVMFDMDASTNNLLYQVPMCWVAQMFQFWKGDVIFRFRFVCSQFHRGRIRISYDPSGNATQNIGTTAVTQSTVFNEIIDLTKDTNVEVRVPYNQALAWCKTFQPTAPSQIPWTISSTPSFDHTPGITNGTLNMRVLNALTAPVASSTIQCLVSVRGADNCEFAGPIDVFRRYSTFAAQSLDEYEQTVSSEIIAGTAPSMPSKARYLVNHGEHLTSLRQVLRRYSIARYDSWQTASPAVLSYYRSTFSRMPLAYGFDPSGQYTAKGLTATTTTFPYNMVQVHPICWVSMCFIGQRGSINWSFNVESGSPIRSLSVGRNSGTQGIGTGTGVNAGGTTSVNSDWFVSSASLYNNSASGSALTNQLTNGGLNIQCPMYSAYKFNTTNPTTASNPSSAQDDMVYQLLKLNILYNSVTSPSVQLFQYAAIGTDWSALFFLNVPTIVVYAGNPVPV